MERLSGDGEPEAEHPSASNFVARFAAAWASPDLDKHRALWHPDIRLVQPMASTTEGVEACLDQMAGVFKLIPDLRAEVHAAEASETLAFIEFTLQGTFAGRPIAWRAIDRFTLSEGLILERVSYFDSLPLILTLLRRPTGWLHWFKSRPRA